jgi:hypothetical protein
MVMGVGGSRPMEKIGFNVGVRLGIEVEAGTRGTRGDKLVMGDEPLVGIG